VPHGDRCMHEFVASAKALRREKKISAMDVGKRLLDHGYHAPTVYFPLVVPEALMIEPTETEPKETLDAFCDAMLSIAKQAETDQQVLKDAPHSRPVSRPDEAQAAKRMHVRHTFEEAPA
ncbi:MAG: aminomethyl-transferring glycine dehydrogenase subunit GcvPB, partial [Gaiellales bacterium]